MTRPVAVVVLAGCFLMAGGCSGRAGSQTGKFLPPVGKALLVIGQDKEAIQGYQDAFQQTPAGFMFYTSIQRLEGLDGPADSGGGVQDGRYLIENHPGTILQIGLYLVHALDDVIAGKYDDNMTRLGEWIKASQRPVYLRIGYEFDDPENHYFHEDYKDAYRYIVDRLRAMNVSNVAFVWHSYGFVDLQRPMMNWYPGDDYVDWFGVSFFDVYNQSGLDFVANRAREHDKPLMIAESTPRGMNVADGEKTWQRWFTRMFDYVDQNDVKMICYINCDWEEREMFAGQGWGDSRLQANDIIRQRWQETVKDKAYLRSSRGLFKKLGFSLKIEKRRDEHDG